MKSIKLSNGKTASFITSVSLEAAQELAEERDKAYDEIGELRNQLQALMSKEVGRERAVLDALKLPEQDKVKDALRAFDRDWFVRCRYTAALKALDKHLGSEPIGMKFVERERLPDLYDPCWLGTSVCVKVVFEYRTPGVGLERSERLVTLTFSKTDENKIEKVSNEHLNKIEHVA